MKRNILIVSLALLGSVSVTASAQTPPAGVCYFYTGENFTGDQDQIKGGEYIYFHYEADRFMTASKSLSSFNKKISSTNNDIISGEYLSSKSGEGCNALIYIRADEGAGELHQQKNNRFETTGRSAMLEFNSEGAVAECKC